MKRLKKRMTSAFAGVAALCLLAACNLEPFPAAPGAAAGKTGRVVITVALPGEAGVSRTLLPEYGELNYTVTITKNGETTPVFDEPISGASATVDLEAWDYMLTVIAYKTDPAVPAAVGRVPVTVLAGEPVDITVSLTLNQDDAGTLDYAVTLPDGMTLTRGFLTLYPLSGSTDPINVDLSGANNPFTTNGAIIPSGYYRAQLSIYGNSGGTVGFATNTGVLHVIDSLTTTASYTFTADYFTDTELYIVENSTELNNALTSIRDASETIATILISASFSSSPVSLTDSGYNGKTIILRGGGIQEISLSAQGSLFTIGTTAVAPVFTLRDITLKGINNNNAPLLKLNNGDLIMELGAVVTGNTVSIVSSSREVIINTTASAHGGGVYVVGGSFIMKGNASISGNTTSASASSSFHNSSFSASANSYGGGVYITGGNFTMQNNASISGNTAYAYASGYNISTAAYGGGVYIAGGRFTIQANASVSGNIASASINGRDGYIDYANSYGGGIYAANGTFLILQGDCLITENGAIAYNENNNNDFSNSLYSYGGGVYVHGGGNLTKTDGTISNRNYAGGSGNAIYYNASPARYRNTTVGPSQNLSTGSNANWTD
jgi:hypothetical protein